MTFKNIDTAILRSFVCVIELGTFKLAAEELNCTQSAISQQMARFEKELGFRLFKKMGRNKQPTDRGMKVYVLVKAILKLNDEFYKKVELLK